MKRIRRWKSSFAALIAAVVLAQGVPARTATAAINERAVVTRRRVVIVRTGKLARQFPHRWRAVVNYPVISGIADTRVLRKVRATLELKNIFDTTLEEYRQDAWLEEFEFKVNYNRNQLLDITFWQTGSGAYPDTHRAHFTISLRTGNVLKARDVFRPDSLESLRRMAQQRLLEEVRQMSAVVDGDESIAVEDRPALKETLSALSFRVEDLDQFVVSDAGLTFLYEAGFPHVIKALEPEGEYFFSYAQLASHIRREGPLGRFVK